ncbi:8-oxo-dGTP diphosphatase [Psychromicrobium silvestre]|uniref:8-oxo-dGTP diphosphatase n=1 Tax=Psychromicrobium silvestre TaxID=1645614 RepID=A0A7Y9LT53_9MICC|nr:NUDIX hydrolase [Psychromicrobium silvestre]NYE95112.1 8-oxo-dGTP diphosphatase [Psychromicrobium silvestre]
MSPSFATRPAAYAVIVRDQEILLAYWSENGEEGWTMPGGGLDHGEHPVDGAIREVFEETGYQVVIERPLGVDVFAPSAPIDGQLRQSIRFLYQATVTGGELTAEQNGSTTHAAWIPLAQVPSLNRVPLVDAALRIWREKPQSGKLASQPEDQ